MLYCVLPSATDLPHDYYSRLITVLQNYNDEYQRCNEIEIFGSLQRKDGDPQLHVYQSSALSEEANLESGNVTKTL